MADMHLIESIHRCDQDIVSSQKEAKEVREAMKSEIEQLDEYKAIEEIRGDLKVAVARLEQAVRKDPEIARLQASLDDEKAKLRDLAEILSHHLVIYYGEETKTVLQDANGDDRDILINAKLGKPRPHQEELSL